MKGNISHSSLLVPPKALLLTVVTSMCDPAARAGLTVDIHVYRNENDHAVYGWLSTNNVPPSPPLGDYLIRSPHFPTNGTHLRYSHSPSSFIFLGGGGSGTDNFDAFMTALTNGSWTIQVTNATSTNTYTFNVTTAGLSSNLLNSVSISYPMWYDTNVPANPTFTWEGGPSGWLGVLDVEVYDDPFTYYEYETISPTETSWNSPTPLPVGTNEFYMAYRSNATATIVASTPVDGSLNPISGWVSSANIEITDLVQFITQSNAPPPAAAEGLVAHYRFDNPVLLGTDSSTNGYDLNAGGSWNGGDVFDTTDAVAGGGAVEFYTDGGNGGGFLSYNPTPAGLLSVLTSNFSISLWVKTTQSLGNSGDYAFDGAGVVSAEIPGLEYDVLPVALTAGEAAFNTGGDTDYTINSTTNINDGAYHHIVVTRNQAAGQKQIYVDGALNVSDFDNADVLDAPVLLTIGAIMDASVSDPGSAGPYNGYEGLLDDLQIYSRVLSAGQVAYLYSHPGLNAPAASTNPPVDVEMQLGIVRNQDHASGDVFHCFPFINSVNISEVTEHRVESPNGHFSGSLSGSGSYTMSSLQSLLDECTNGVWKLYLNRSNVDEQVFTFSVIINGLDTNVLQKVTILSPTNGSTGVSTSPALAWSGPTGFQQVFSQKYNLPYNNVVATNQPGTATNWPSPPALSPGTNRLYLSYHSNNVPLITFTTPVDGASLPINSWSATAYMNSDATAQFVVSALPSPVQLVAAQRNGSNFQFQFLSQSGTTNIVQSRTNVATGSWQDRTNIPGDGTLKTVILPIGPTPREFFHVLTQ